ncbi:MAG: hypothetical protein PVF04_06200, partial [Anaerolineae bacterium]
MLYYAGTARPASLLVVADSDVARSGQLSSAPLAILFVRRALEHVRLEATVDRVESIRGFSDIAATFAELGLESGVLGTTLDVIPAQL